MTFDGRQFIALSVRGPRALNSIAFAFPDWKSRDSSEFPNGKDLRPRFL